MIKFFVTDIEKLKGIPIWRTKNSMIYIAVYHPELKWWQNIICNFGVAEIQQGVTNVI